MTTGDRDHWDRRWARRPPAEPSPPEAAAGNLDLLPTTGRALDVACGQGAQAVWMALRGLRVTAVDVSPLALAAARALAELHGVADRVTFSEHDMDAGPPGGAGDLDLIVCQRFLHRGFLGGLADRLTPGGVAAISVLSDVGAPRDAVGGGHRVRPGELVELLPGLEILDSREGNGVASVLARRP